MFTNKVAPQLACPTQSLAGWMVSKFFESYNRILEENAVKLCEIQPDDTVLEVGFGPGLGLQAAAPLLSGPAGKLIGVDYSEYMHKKASERVKNFVASGKVILHHGSVAAMPISDNSVDKVFHCNSYYFWPDLRQACSELHRVMKPGGLMVTTMKLHRIAKCASQRLLSGDNWHPEVYMEALRTTGFKDVRMENKTDKGTPFQAIFATASK